MDSKTFQNVTRFFERLIGQRQQSGYSVSSTVTLTALKASIWVNLALSSCHFLCQLHHGFQWGYGDMNEVLKRIECNYRPFLDNYRRRPFLTVNLPHCPLPWHWGSTGYDPVDLTSLVGPNLPATPAVFSRGLHMQFRCQERRPDDDARWSNLLFGTLKMLHSLAMGKDMIERLRSTTDLVLFNVSKEGAVAFAQMVSLVSPRPSPGNHAKDAKARPCFV
jgi:hypothetical protein